MFGNHLVLQLVWMVSVQQLTSVLSVSSSERIERGLTQARSRLSSRSALLNEDTSAALYAAGASTEADSYQGLVGRPGIDFPVLTQIPRTVFDCKNHGNGYFADLETRCQVFHICDEGKKISFLCPNGTIFRQLDLICDWWFKVDCAATPNHFAESTEMLTQAKRARLQSKHPVPQPINPNDERLTTSIQDKRLLLESAPANQRQSQRQAYPLEPIGNVLEFNRRMDTISSAETPGGIGDRGSAGSNRNRKGARKISFTTADEIQDTAQSASFASVAQKMFNSYYAHDKPSKDAIVDKLRTENQADGGSPLRDRSILQDPKDAPAKGYSNNHAVNYIPYTTARKLNLSGKVTQFYTPTVPTFTTSAKTTVVEATSATTKATIKSGDGDVESHIRTGQSVPVRRDGIIDESVMDHAMEIMQTIKSLKIDEPGNNENTDDGSSEALRVHIADRRNDYPQSSSLPPALLSSPLPATDSVKFLLQSSGSEANADRYERMRLGERRADVDVGHRSLLTRATINEYDRLFRAKDAEDGNHVDNIHNNLTDSDQYYMDSASEHDLEGQSSRYPVFGMSNSTQIRELAQIFTHALSAYLQDPITFRRILTEIRPKAPPMESTAYLPGKPGELEGKNRSNLGKYTTDDTMSFRSTAEQSLYAPLRAAENVEVLDFSDVSTTTTGQNPTETTATETTVAITSTIPPTTTSERLRNAPKTTSGVKQGKSLSIQFITSSRNELADEVNGELGAPALANNHHSYTDHGSFEERSNPLQAMPTLTPSYNDRSETYLHKQPSIGTSTPADSATTEQIPTPQSVLKPPVMPSTQYTVVKTPKTTQPLDDEEQLQHAQSESILGSHHQRPIYERNQYSIIQLNNLKSSNFGGDTPSTITTTIATDGKSSETEKQTSNGAPLSRTTMSYTVFFDPLTINDELMELDKPKPTASHASTIHQPRLYGWNGTLLNAPGSQSSQSDISALPSARLVMAQPENAADMQQKANEMFGDLNDAQADKLMSMMKMADKDKSMRRLILLLIRTCDDDPTTANEESRKALLDALMNIDDVAQPHITNELNGSHGQAQVRGSGHRRGKKIGADTPRILYDGAVQSNNITATTENYATVGEFMAESSETGASEGASKEDGVDSDELSREGTSHTTAATTRMYYSSEAQTGYRSSNSNEIRGRWANEYDEAQQTQTTTPLPTTIFQTTTNTGPSTILTTTEATTLPTTILTTSGSDYASSTAGTTTTSATNPADEFVESFESDPSLELQPPVIVSPRLPKDLSSSLDHHGSGGDSKKHNSPHYSDTRALELLKSLYSLAARWG